MNDGSHDFQLQCGTCLEQSDTILGVGELEESWRVHTEAQEAKYPKCLPLVDTNVHPESGGPLSEEFMNCLFWQHSNGARVGCDQGFPSPSTNRELWEWILGRERQISLQTEGGVWKVFLPTHPLPRPRSSHLNLEARAAPPLVSHFP